MQPTGKTIASVNLFDEWIAVYRKVVGAELEQHLGFQALPVVRE